MDKKKTSFKKQARHSIESKIGTGLADLKAVLGEKEFEARVKKAAKIFAKGLKETIAKTPAPSKAKHAIPAPKKAVAITPKPVVAKTAKKAVKVAKKK